MRRRRPAATQHRGSLVMLSTCAVLVLGANGMAAAAEGSSGVDDARKTAAIEPRIVGGAPAGVGEYPYFASVQTSSGFHRCGGALVSATEILTAARPATRYNRVASGARCK
jgi:secreted trypsin-like serine protease